MIQTQSAPAPAEAGAGAHSSDPSSASSLHRRPQEPPFNVSSVGKIKFADPRSLPSYPSFGLRSGGAATDAAATASRTTSDQRPAERSNSDEERTASATAAAFVAKDYKMPPAWEPSFDQAGPKAAAAAVESADAALKKPDIAEGGIDSGFGSTAAEEAFNAKRPSSPAKEGPDRAGAAAARASYMDRAPSEKAELPPISFDDESLAAALGAISGSKKADSESQDAKTHQGQPQAGDATTASASALEGATVAHKESMRAVPQEDIGATSVTTMTRAMFTAQPPVKPETDEIEENERVHQSAVAMAKKMYRNQRVTTDREGNVVVSNPFGNLQDIAFRQAQERLASLQDDEQKAQEYKDYYAGKDEDKVEQEPVPRRRLSLMTKLRRRSSDSGRPEDRRRQRKTNQEMPLFGHRLSRAEQEQRDRDREAVLAAAHRNVKLQLQGMDDQANRESRRSEADSRRRSEREGEDQAPARAQTFPQAQSDTDGRIDIGGGRFMDATEIDAIAARRVGPLLADIDGSVEADRGRMANLRAEEETRRADLRRQRSRSRERKEIEKRFKEEDKREAKARKVQAKQDEKARKEMAKEAKTERKRQLKEDKRRRQQIPVAGQSEAHSEAPGEGGGGNPGRESTAADGAAADGGDSPRQSAQEPARDSRHEGSTGASNPGSNPGPSGGCSKQSSSPMSKVAGWFKSRLSRKKGSGKEDKKSKKGFVGGAALRESGDNEAGAGGGNEETPRRAERERTSHQGPMSDDGTLSNSHQSLEAPQAMAETPPVSSSPARDSRFREIMDQ